MLLVPCRESYLSHQHTQSYVCVLCYLSHVVNPICPQPTHSILCVCPMLLVPCSESYLSHQHTQSSVSVLCYLSHVVNSICPTNALNRMCLFCATCPILHCQFARPHVLYIFICEYYNDFEMLIITYCVCVCVCVVCVCGS